MNKIKVMTVVGTRPEIIKLSQVIKELDINVDHTIVHTGQNYDYELNELFFEQLGIRKPDIFLDAIMSPIVSDGVPFIASKNISGFLIPSCSKNNSFNS